MMAKNSEHNPSIQWRINLCPSGNALEPLRSYEVKFSGTLAVTDTERQLLNEFQFCADRLSPE